MVQILSISLNLKKILPSMILYIKIIHIFSAEKKEKKKKEKKSRKIYDGNFDRSEIESQDQVISNKGKKISWYKRINTNRCVLFIYNIYKGILLSTC